MAQALVKEQVGEVELKNIYEGLEVHPLTLQLLHQRGIRTKTEADVFMNPSYERDIKNPFDIHGVPEAVERIIAAFKVGEKIAVYSDYDCDGIPGGVLLRTFFDDIGYPVEMYVPHRHNEGYGLHKHAFDSLKRKGVSLVITVDLAITNIDEVAYAKSIGIDVIVTDHHLPITKELEGKKKKGEKAGEMHTVQVVPDTVAVINSKQDVCTYHDDMLCGCAVAWKLSCAILSRLRDENKNETDKKVKAKAKKGDSIALSYQKVLDSVAGLKEGYEKWLLDLVGISTIADMVPLQKENRALAHFGLKVLRQTKRHGLNHIFRAQGVAKEHIVEDDIAFTIAPRVNAASRMGDPIQAHNMLYAKDSVEAQKFVEDLEDLNTERKAGVKDIVSTLSFDHAVYQNDVIVVGDPSWGPGILGLIAQNIIDETGKPTFVWGCGEDDRRKAQGASKIQLQEEGEKSNDVETVPAVKMAKGSCRSKGDVHVVDLMARAIEMFPGVLLHSGGHEQAGGFSADLARIGELSDVLNAAYKHVEIKTLENQELVADAVLTLSDVLYATHAALAVLAPFGVGNPKPLFAFVNVTPKSVRWFGKKGEHLEVVYDKTPGEVKAIQFFSSKATEEKLRNTHTLLAHLEKSVFRGKIEMRLRFVEVL